MSITNPQTDNKNKVIQVRRSLLLACGLSFMIGLSGCSDSGELTQADTGGTQDTSTDTTDIKIIQTKTQEIVLQQKRTYPLMKQKEAVTRETLKVQIMVTVVILVPVEVLVTESLVAMILTKTTRLLTLQNCM